jgi:hypothetical protein
LIAGFANFEAKEADGVKFNTKAPRSNINILPNIVLIILV